MLALVDSDPYGLKILSVYMKVRQFVRQSRRGPAGVRLWAAQTRKVPRVYPPLAPTT